MFRNKQRRKKIKNILSTFVDLIILSKFRIFILDSSIFLGPCSFMKIILIIEWLAIMAPWWLQCHPPQKIIKITLQLILLVWLDHITLFRFLTINQAISKLKKKECNLKKNLIAKMSQRKKIKKKEDLVNNQRVRLRKSLPHCKQPLKHFPAVFVEINIQSLKNILSVSNAKRNIIWDALGFLAMLQKDQE